MKFIEELTKIVKHTPKELPETYLALVVDTSYVQAAAWILDSEKKPRVIASASELAPNPSWEDRIKMADHAIGKLDEQLGNAKLTKVVLGLGEQFLTPEGDIEKSIRPPLKELTKSLGLTPLGFVPIPTSIAHYLRKTEGIPTSVILIGITDAAFDVSIYRVGRLAYATRVTQTESEGVDIETALKACKDAEVLPSRILLFGASEVRAKEVQAVLLKHQWTARANFLHYPKIELFPFEMLVTTVVLAGANELTQELQEVKDEVGPVDAPKATHAELADVPETIKPEALGDTKVVVVQPEALGFHEEHVAELGEKKEMESDEGEFKTNDMPIVQASVEEKKEEEEEVKENPLEFDNGKEENLLISREFPLKEEDIEEKKSSRNFTFPKLKLPTSVAGGMRIGSGIFRRIPKRIAFFAIILIAFLIAGYVVAFRYMPRADVTISVLPKTITVENTITIDPAATAVSLEKNIVPATKVETTVTGEKTIPTSGKKKVGDQAKGTVTIFNKTLSSVTLKKGTIIQTSSLAFSLNAEVSIASASEDLVGTRTYGKAAADVTAQSVGPDSNVPAKTNFSVKEYSTEVLSAMNDVAFTGGTSRDVTVVTRADTETLVKALTADLVAKAKEDLAKNVTGNARMIDATVKTTVKEKQFTQEIDEESKELHGTMTLAVVAYTYSDEDVKSLLIGQSQSEVPVGYTVNPGRTTVDVGQVTIAKSGSMSAKATLTTSALPTVNAESIKTQIAGKKLSEVETELKAMPGIAGAEFRFRTSIKKDALPIQPDHIAVSVVTVE